MLTSITGINWGDEGKGRMVDLLSQDYDIVARYQGGDNAGHTVNDILLLLSIQVMICICISWVYCRYRPSVIIQSPCLLQKLLPASFCIIHRFLRLIHY